MFKLIRASALICLFLTACSSDTISEFEPKPQPKPVDPGRGIEPVESKRAYELTNSVGINTHIAFSRSNYWKKWDEIALPRLKEIGIKHVRDGSIYLPKAEERFIELGKEGIELLLITTSETSDKLAKKLDALLPYLSGIEIYNEPDYFYHSNPAIWVPFMKDNLQTTYNLVKNTPKYSHLPIVGASLASLNNGIYVGDISGWIDYGNIHSYPTGFHPINNWGYSMLWDVMSDKAVIMFGNKPLIATETGYHNYTQLREGFVGVPEDISAIYLPHLIFEYFNNGIIRTYIYELLDALECEDGQDEKERHFGLIRADGTAKPAFYALKNLITLLKDENSNFQPMPLGYKLTIPSHNNDDIKQTLLQKSDGSWWIALYRTSEIYHAASFSKIPMEPIKVILDLNYTANKINLYTPNRSIEHITFSKTNSLEFDLGPELVLIEVVINNTTEDQQ